MADINYSSLYTAEQIDSLGKILPIDISNNSWEVIPSTEAMPVDISNIIDIGNYIIDHYLNGPIIEDFEMNSPSSVRVIVYNNDLVLTQVFMVGYYIFYRIHNGTVYEEWRLPNNQTPIHRGAIAPDFTEIDKGNLWIDSSNENTLIFKRYNGTTWNEIFSTDNLGKNVYDENAREIDIFAYISERLAHFHTTLLDATIKTNDIASAFHCTTYDDSAIYASTADHSIMKSINNGITWTVSKPILGTGLYTIIAKNGIIVAANDQSTTNQFAISINNGMSWTPTTVPVFSVWKASIYTDNSFVVIGTGGITLFSIDGINWIRRDIPELISNGILGYSDNTLAVFDPILSIICITKDNGINWETITLPTLSVATTGANYVYGNGLSAILLSNGHLVISSDFESWVQMDTVPASTFTKIIFHKGLFILFSSTAMWYSYDCNDWFEYIHDTTTNEILIPTNTSILLGSMSNYNTHLDFAIDTMINRIMTHVDLTSIHITASNRNSWNAKESTTGSDTKVTMMNLTNNTYTDDKINTLNTRVINSNAEVTNHNTAQTNHVDSVSHATPAEKLAWDSKAADTHTHLSDDKVELDASDVVSGIFDITRMPDAAIERVLTVHGNAAKLALTQTQIQTGDTVRVLACIEGVSSSINAPWQAICYGDGLFVAIAGGVIASDVFATSTNGITWTQRTAPVSAQWISVCYGNGLFVAVAGNTATSNVFATSTDGITWTQRTAPVSTQWISVCYGNGVFVAVAFNSTVIATSPDGITWTQRTAPVSVQWYSICYGNGLFVAVATAAVIATSPDGITWTQRTAPVSSNWRSVCYGNGLFVAIAHNSANAMTSFDGIMWTQRTLPLSSYWRSVCYGNGLFVAITGGATASTVAAISTDGMVWTEKVISISSKWISVCYGNGVFVAVDNSGTYITHFTNEILNNSYYRVIDDTKLNLEAGYVLFDNISAGMVEWANVVSKPSTIVDYDINDSYSMSEVTDIISETMADATVDASSLVLDIQDDVDLLESDLELHRTNATMHPSVVEKSLWNGKAEGAHTHLSDERIEITANDIVSGVFDIDRLPPEAFMRLKTFPNKSAMYGLTTADVRNGDIVNITNEPATSACISAPWYSICYANDLFVAVAYNSNIIMTSPDGITWTQRTAPTITRWYSVCYGDGIFVAIARNTDIIMTSPDGITWTQRTVPISTAWISVGWGNGLFVAVPYDDNIFITSPDGITWTQRTAPTTAYWYSVCYGNGTFVVVSYGSSDIATSPDGITWTQRTAPTSANWCAVCYGNGLFVSVAYSNDACMTSPDGITWTPQTLPINATLRSICYGNGTFVAIAYGNASALISTDGITWINKSINTIANWRGLCYGNGIFVVVGDNLASVVRVPINMGHSSFYKVLDIANLNSDFGYLEFATTVASRVRWNNIINTPVGISSYGINDAYTKNESNPIIAQITSDIDVYTDTIFTSLAPAITNTTNAINNHKIDAILHTTVEKETAWNDKASGTHSHLLDDNVGVDGSQITEGIIALDRLPLDAIDKAVSVFSEIEKFALTKSTIQNGDVVIVHDDYKINTIGYAILTFETSNGNILNIQNNGEDVSYNVSDTSNILYEVCCGNNLFVAIGGGNVETTTFARSTDGITWIKTSAPISAKWRSICYGNGVFVAIAKESNIAATSLDGITWTQRTLPASVQWYSICYGNGKFVAISGGTVDSAIVATSPDGITWTQRTLAISRKWYSVCYGNGLFVAVASNTNSMMTSPDGITWTQRTLPIIANYQSICYGNSMFVAIAGDNTKALTSPDGITWTQQTLPTTANWVSITYSNGAFVIVGGTMILKSADGINWLIRHTDQNITWQSNCSNDGTFVNIGFTETSTICLVLYAGNRCYKVVDDTNLNNIGGYMRFNTTNLSQVDWSMLVNRPTSIDGYKIIDLYNTDMIDTYIDECLQAELTDLNNDIIIEKALLFDKLALNTSRNDTIDTKIATTNAITLTPAIYNESNINITCSGYHGTISLLWKSVCYGNGLFVAVASNTNSMMTSPDGITWTQRSLPVVGSYYWVVYGNGLFVTIGYNSNIILTSPNGINWTQRTAPVTANWNALCYENGLFVAAASISNIILTSPDGITWTQRTAPVSADCRVVGYGNGLFVTIGYISNIILTSPDGITWTQRTAPIIANWKSLTYGNGLFVTIGYNSNIILTSPDGITWTQRTAPVIANWQCVIFAEGLFVAIASGINFIITSPDGITWTQRTAPISLNWISVCYGNNKFIAIANSSNVILTFNYGTIPYIDTFSNGITAISTLNTGFETKYTNILTSLA